MSESYVYYQSAKQKSNNKLDDDYWEVITVLWPERECFAFPLSTNDTGI